MFISNSEKKYLFDQVKIISALTKDMSLAATEITMLKAKIKVLEGKKPETKKPRKQSTMSAEGRARIGAAVKAYHAKKKLEKQNAISISTTGQ